MPRRTLQIEQELPVVWERLQQLSTWEGIGGMGQLRDAQHSGEGRLIGFAYSLDTPLGTVDDTADVTSTTGADGSAEMHVRTETKGLRVTIDLDLMPHDGTTAADFAIDAQASNFLTKPLAATLRHTLDAGIIRESDRMVERLEQT